MFTNNPYAQGGWYNPQNPLSINHSPWRQSSSHPPTFGALPPLFDRPASVLTFEFSSFNPDLFNCIVTGPKGRKFFEVRTSGARTSIVKPGELFATIDWNQHPIVEAPGVISRQLTMDFLKLSSDQTYRIIVIGNKAYAWIPRGAHGIYLYSYSPNPPVQFARISLSNGADKIYLEITSEAFQAGLFEPCVVSMILLFSGRNID